MIDRVRLNDKNVLKKQRRSVSKKPPELNINTSNIVRLPPELNFGLDRRTGVGKSTHRRLCGYVRQITDNGRRSLRASEVASLKMVILLEQKIDAQFDQYHHDKLNPEDLKALSSELRRQLAALGLYGPRAATGSASDTKPREVRQPDDESLVDKFLARIESLAGRLREQENEQPAPDKVSTRKRRRKRKQRKLQRPAPKPAEQEDDRHIKEGVRRNGAWFPSDRYPRDF